MADAFDNTTPQSERVAFCQDCGKPLTAETVRNVGSGVFCEPCLEKRIGSVPPTPPSGGAYPGGFGTTVPPVGAVPPVQPTNLPSPAAAGWLAVLPGAGAVYNGQYAKGLVIFVICMVLFSLGDHNNSIFGIAALVFWIFQIIDAHHTAKARILGTPLPNPFGLNDIGDRMGFGKNWPGSMYHPVSQTPPTGPTATTVPPTGVPVPPVPPANWAGYVHPENFAQPAQTGAWTSTPYQAAAPSTPYVPVEPQPSPWSEPSAMVPPTAHTHRFPVAALVLILLGILALTNSVFHFEVSGSWVAALVLAVFGVWALAHRVQHVHRDHPEGVNSSVMLSCVLRGPAIMMIVLAVLFTLQAAHSYTLGQTWPVIVILSGLQLLVHRAIDRTVHMPGVNAPYAWPGTAASPAPQATRVEGENGGAQ